MLASGLLQEWLEAGVPLDFGPAPAPYGDLHLRIEPAATAITVAWQAHWRCQPPRLTVALPGLEPVVVDSARTSGVTIPRTQKGHNPHASRPLYCRFDSASASLQAVASYLHGKDFTGLGIFRWSRRVVRW